MEGTKIELDEFIDEYNNRNDEDGLVEIVDVETNKITQITEEEFKEIIKK